MAMVVAGLHLGGRASGIIAGAGGGQKGEAWRSGISCVRGRVALRETHQQAGTGETSSTANFDAEAFEAERLKLDARARDAMADEAEKNRGPGAWKWAIRKRIWDSMEVTNVANDPRPVHHRIPNFEGAAEAAARLAKLPAFEAAGCVKVNPDTPQKPVRYLTLSGGKTLLTPQPRLRTGFFSTLKAAANVPPGVQLIAACSSAGAAKYGEPVGLDADLKVDLIVIGSVAVDPTTGARLGKGEGAAKAVYGMPPDEELLGFAELEYGMLRYMGAVNDHTLVVTSVHDMQVVEEGLIPTEKLLIHDVPVDVICTPTRTIFTNGSIPKPQGIYWEKLSPQKLGQIRILRILKKSIEEKTGKALPTGSSEQLPPTAKRSPKIRKKSSPDGLRR